MTTQTTAARLRAWLRSLRRITTSGQYFPEIDGLRFVAIFSVVFFHVYAQTRKEAPLPPVLDTFISHGDRGVRLFFAISGFILALPFCAQFHGAHRKVDLRRYFLRRLTRLEPPYLLSLVAAVCDGSCLQTSTLRLAVAASARQRTLSAQPHLWDHERDQFGGVVA